MSRDFCSESADAWIKRLFGWPTPDWPPHPSSLHATGDEDASRSLGRFTRLVGDRLVGFIEEMRPAMEAAESPSSAPSCSP